MTDNAYTRRYLKDPKADQKPAETVKKKKRGNPVREDIERMREQKD